MFRGSSNSGVDLSRDVNKKKNKKNYSIDKSKRRKSLEGAKKSSLSEMIRLRKAAVGIGEDKMVLLRSKGGKLFINIRRYRWDEHCRCFATKTGILLTPDEWMSLKEETSIFDNVARLCGKTDVRKLSAGKNQEDHELKKPLRKKRCF
jgi:hypothetical protein